MFLRKITFLFVIFFYFALVGYGFCFAAEGLELQYPEVHLNGETLKLEAGTSLPKFAKYLIGVGMFVGFFSAVISLAIGGVMYLLSPAFSNADLTARARDRMSGAISGALILTLFYLFLSTLNPDFNILKTAPLPPAEISPPDEHRPQGVYFHLSGDCNDDDPKIETSNVADFGAGFSNRIKSASMESGENGTAYISLVYDNPDFRGKCQYVNPNSGCSPIDNDKMGVVSASVYEYNDSPGGGSVTFYRKPFYNEKGGYFKVSGISGIYEGFLDEMDFSEGGAGGECTVPEEEQGCEEFEDDGSCLKENRICPTLAGGNIKSIEIKGGYLVVFIYYNPKEEGSSYNSVGPWTSCMAYPKKTDVNKKGPANTKWDPIMNNKIEVPNYVMIFPIKN